MTGKIIFPMWLAKNIYILGPVHIQCIWKCQPGI